MNILGLAEETTGGRWTGATLHYGRAPDGTLACQDMRLCEAVARSLSETIVLPAERIQCPGARRSLAIENSDEELARKMASESGIALATTSRVVKDTPRLTTPPAALTLGQHESPDVVIGYIWPDMAMNLIRRWQQVYGTDPTVKLASFMAICGDVLVGAYELQQLRLCFGCRDSRKYGEVEDETLVVGMSHCLAISLFQEGH